MKFNLTKHAKRMQIERGFTDREIRETVLLGVKTLQHRQTLKADKGVLSVVFKKAFKEKIVVITVMLRWE